MRCKRCHMDCQESELFEGYCEACRELMTNEKPKILSNKVADKLEMFYVFFILMGFIALGGCIFFQLIGIGIGCLLGCLFLGLILKGLSEIIHLLEDLKYKKD